MPVKITVTFAEGVTREDITRTEEAGGGGDGMPPGMLNHTEQMIDGRLVFIDEWESREQLDGFINMARSTFEQVGVPFPDIEIEDI